MKEYIAICETDNLILGKHYLGREENNSVVLTHVVSSDRPVQLTESIYTIANNVVPSGNNLTVGINGKLKPYPRKRADVRFVVWTGNNANELNLRSVALHKSIIP